MVNYLYDRDAIEANHEAFVHSGQVVRSAAVDGLLSLPRLRPRRPRVPPWPGCWAARRNQAASRAEPPDPRRMPRRTPRGPVSCCGKQVALPALPGRKADVPADRLDPGARGDVRHRHRPADQHGRAGAGHGLHRRHAAVGMSSTAIIAGFPGDLFVTLVGITYLFAIAQKNGTIDWLVHQAVRAVGGRIAAIPWIMFGVAAALTAVGAVSPGGLRHPGARRAAIRPGLRHQPAADGAAGDPRRPGRRLLAHQHLWRHHQPGRGAVRPAGRRDLALPRQPRLQPALRARRLLRLRRRCAAGPAAGGAGAGGSTPRCHRYRHRGPWQLAADASIAAPAHPAAARLDLQQMATLAGSPRWRSARWPSASMSGWSR